MKYKRETVVLVVLFIVAFVLNLVWEQLHHVLYVHYQSGEITNLILLRAAFFDASFITVVFGWFALDKHRRRYAWIPALVALLFAIGLERFALETGRWAYTTAMPLIPLLGVGLSPTVQLSLTGLASFWGIRYPHEG